MSRSSTKKLIAITLTFSLMLSWYSLQAHADTSLTVGGVSISVPSNITEPSGFDAVNVSIGYQNGSNNRLLSIGYVVVDANGVELASDSKIDVPVGASGSMNSSWYGFSFAKATKPFKIILKVSYFISTGIGDAQSSASLTLIQKTNQSAPLSSPSPAPTVTITATPAPTVTITATPAPTVTITATPAPTVTITATPAPTIPSWVNNQLTANKLQLETLEQEVKSLKAKFKKICSAKPKPKGC